MLKNIVHIINCDVELVALLTCSGKEQMALKLQGDGMKFELCKYVIKNYFKFTNILQTV